MNQTQVNAVDFLQAVLVQFGFSPFKMKKAELIATLNNFLIEQHGAGRKVLLIVDEAQNLSLRVLEEIRLLSGVETTKEKVLRIILAGQPELNDKLDAPELDPARTAHPSAIPSRDAVSARRCARTSSIVSRWPARAIGRYFAEDTFNEIFRYTGGTPRLVNTLCDTAMMSAFASSRDCVTLGDVAQAIDELQWVEYATRQQQQHAKLVAAAQWFKRITPRPQRACWALPRLPRTARTPRRRRSAAFSSRPDGRTVQEVPLKVGRIIVGRTTDNDVQIDSRFVSRHHCQVITTPHACVIEDLNSTNGIYVKSKRVRRHYLNDGDVVQLGKHELIYIDERLPRVRAPFTETVPGVPPAEPVVRTDDELVRYSFRLVPSKSSAL